MATTNFSCVISTTDPTVSLTLTIRFDQQVIAVLMPVPVDYYFEYQFEDTDHSQEHCLEFELLGKLPEHTQIDDQGNFIQDATVTIQNKSFESIKIDPVVDKTAVYYHDFNGSQEPIEDQFFGTMGCNGRVEFKFTTPIYLWMLENL